MVLKNHFWKYYFIFAPALLLGIAILLVVDFYQLRIPENTSEMIGVYRVFGDLIEADPVIKYSPDDDNWTINYTYEEAADEDVSKKAIQEYKVIFSTAASAENNYESFQIEVELELEKTELKIIKINHNLDLTLFDGEVLFLLDRELIKTDINNKILPLLKAIIILLVVVSLGRVFWRYFIFGTSRKVEERIRNEMFAHSTNLSHSYYSQEKVGGLMTYFINDLSAIRMAFGPGLMMIVDGLFLGTLTLIKMFKIDVMLTIYAFVPLIALAILMLILRKSMHHRFKERQQSFEEMSDFVQENFSGFSVIKAYVKEAASAIRFEYRTKDFYEKNIAFVKQRLYFQIAITIALNVVTFTLIGYGGYLVINGNFTPEVLFLYITYFGMLTWPVMALTRVITISSQASASASRISEFLDQPIDVNDDLAIEISELQGSITANNLSFSYPDEPDVMILENLSFTINKGEMVGILGKTGSGKSTLVDLMLRVYNVELGTLLIDNHDIMTIPLKQLRETIGYVPQDNFLFSDTIKANIGFSQDFLNDEVIIEASKLSDVYQNIVEFKEGFETVLGERGVTVSGGQKQRISIARALAKDPEILILDDSVSAVDTKTEESIIKNLLQVRRAKTTILIAHRISTVRNMDKIILLDKGRLIGLGTHDELMKSSPVYKEMVKLQTLTHLEEEGGDSHV